MRRSFGKWLPAGRLLLVHAAVRVVFVAIDQEKLVGQAHFAAVGETVTVRIDGPDFHRGGADQVDVAVVGRAFYCKRAKVRDAESPIRYRLGALCALG